MLTIGKLRREMWFKMGCVFFFAAQLELEVRFHSAFFPALLHHVFVAHGIMCVKCVKVGVSTEPLWPHLCDYDVRFFAVNLSDLSFVKRPLHTQ